MSSQINPTSIKFGTICVIPKNLWASIQSISLVIGYKRGGSDYFISLSTRAPGAETAPVMISNVYSKPGRHFNFRDSICFGNDATGIQDIHCSIQKNVSGSLASNIDTLQEHANNYHVGDIADYSHRIHRWDQYAQPTNWLLPQTGIITLLGIMQFMGTKVITSQKNMALHLFEYQNRDNRCSFH